MGTLMKKNSQEILEILRQRIGSLKTGDRFFSEAALCAEFEVSRMTANKINNQLVNEGYLYRIKGSGTFVKTPKIAQQPVRFLLPCPDYFVYDCTYDARLMLAGMHRQAKQHNIRIQGVPVSKVNNPEKIDWEELEDFNEDTLVIVCGLWYKKVFPFLIERKCKVIFCDFHSSNPKRDDIPEEWLIVAFDARKAMVETVEFLADRKFRKIAYVYNNYSKDDPLKTGFEQGMLKNKLALNEGNLIYTGNIDDYYDSIENASKDFDVLLLSSPDLVRQTMMILKSSGQKVPEDIAVICFGDRQKFSNLNPSVSAVSIPFYEIGEAIIKSIDNGNFSEIDFKCRNFVRESLENGAGDSPNDFCVLENTANNVKNQFSFFSN